MTFSLTQTEWGEKVDRILVASLQAVEPASAIRRFVQRNADQLIIDGQIYDLASYRRIWVVGAGKAGAPMACAMADILDERLDGGLVIVKDGYLQPCEGLKPERGLRLVEAGHPLPDGRGVRATQEIISLLSDCNAEDLVICLISGGGSALLTAPAPGISLHDLQTLTQLLLASGANINEINALRKHLDQVKGGQLARMAYPAHLATLIVSDVVGNPLDVIASGPTVSDGTTFSDAYAVLERYNLVGQVPQAILAYLQSGCAGEILETPKEGDSIFTAVQNVIVGSNMQAVAAALRQAQQEGFNTQLLTTYMQGEARQVGRLLAAIVRQVATTGQPISRPACVVVGGETTVTLQGDGLGGRNQELALGAVEDLGGLMDVALVTLATDGGDGPTDAAGAVVTGETLQRARQLGLRPSEYLQRNDAYHFFEALGDLIITGPTGTNVNDLAFLFAF